MSITPDALADELGTDVRTVVAQARDLMEAGYEKVLTVGPGASETDGDVACLTDEAASEIRSRVSTVAAGAR
ncbi:hypothetical protein EV383_5709 [Pseudonocardia sediminis]|uniref:Uncharacterized protein n=1 Tax=Pseudonocardia sediminis TaxID=1397368 RepID=A0A4Q7V5I5_PSEST|nr:hypothetical protein [Pseudonocardia sediminis]RZT88764.1 hypothetical protein EV383_5709 [Pseudonocardia sediminis]